MACSCGSCSDVQYTARIVTDDGETVLAEEHAGRAEDAVALACDRYCSDQPAAAECMVSCAAHEGPTVEVSSNKWEVAFKVIFDMLASSCVSHMR